MGPSLFVLAVMGCGDGAADCRQIARDERVFESAAACENATGGALADASDAPYPLLIAQCREASDVLAAAPEPRGWFGESPVRMTF